MSKDNIATAKRALAAAKMVAPQGTDTDLGIAYMRLLVAYRAGDGVRLTADEVYALFTCDSAIAMAAGNIEQELVGEPVDVQPDPKPDRRSL